MQGGSNGVEVAAETLGNVEPVFVTHELANHGWRALSQDLS